MHCTASQIERIAVEGLMERPLELGIYQVELRLLGVELHQWLTSAEAEDPVQCYCTAGMMPLVQQDCITVRCWIQGVFYSQCT